MRALNKYLGSLPQSIKDAFAFIGRPGGVKIKMGPHPVTGDRAGYFEVATECPPSIPPAVWPALYHTLVESEIRVQETWIMAGALGGGLKVFCPTREEYRALGQVDIGVPWEDYHQPFETFVVAVPDGEFPDPVSDDLGHPAAVFVRHDPEAGFFGSMFMGDGPRPTFGTYIRGKSGRTVEEYISELGNVDLDPAESVATTHARRVAMNAALLMTNSPGGVIGRPANPALAADLTRRLETKKLSPAARTANEKALKDIPTVYSFDQSVKLFRREDGAPGGDRTGAHTAPHWRRGHWAHQPHGPGHSLRKLLFRAPVMVNSDRFAGTPAATSTTYRT